MLGMLHHFYPVYPAQKVVILAWKWNVCNSHCQDYISAMQLRLNGCTSSIKHYLRGREGGRKGGTSGKAGR